MIDHSGCTNVCPRCPCRSIDGKQVVWRKWNRIIAACSASHGRCWGSNHSMLRSVPSLVSSSGIGCGKASWKEGPNRTTHQLNSAILWQRNPLPGKALCIITQKLRHNRHASGHECTRRREGFAPQSSTNGYRERSQTPVAGYGNPAGADRLELTCLRSAASQTAYPQLIRRS